MKLKLTNIEL